MTAHRQMSALSSACEDVWGEVRWSHGVRRKYEVVRCQVVGHVRYGLLIESEDGERGFVGSSHITDGQGEVWPGAGQRLRCVVLGYIDQAFASLLGKLPVVKNS